MSLMPQYLLPGHALRQTLDRIQGRIDALHVEREEIRTAPRPVDEAAALFEIHAPRYSALSSAARNAIADSEGIQEVIQRASENLTYADVRWLFGESANNAMRERLEEIVDRSGKSPIDEKTRRTRMAEIDEEIESLHFEEEKEVISIHSTGYRVLRRANTDVQALLRSWERLQPMSVGADAVTNQED